MNRYIFLVLALLSTSSAANVQAQTPAPDPPKLKDCSGSSLRLPGSQVQLSPASGKSAPDTSYSLNLKPVDTTKQIIPVSWSPTDEADFLSFTIPTNADGTYTIEDLKKTNATTPASPLFIGSPSQIVVVTPTITAVSPNAAFKDDHGAHSFTIKLDGLCAAGTNPVVRFDFTEIKTPDYKLTVDNSHEINLTFDHLDSKVNYYTGKKNFVLTVNGTNTLPATLTLIDTTPNMPKTVAIVGLALVLVLIYLLLRSGRSGISAKIDGETYWLTTLFLDEQTNSYSLSKCQFYAWTAASVVAYLYLAVSRSYVQGSAVFPDIPSGLPGILLASVGTVVLSTGITSAKGDKGAGDPRPNLSDFIATGGVVVADRLQFAVWTLVGIGTFLALVFQLDPRNINDLPAIPTGFMQLMGISAAGYIGGKLARKAGPTITAIVLTMSAEGNPRFQITGSGLSRSASFSIDDKPIFPDTILGKDDAPGLPEIVQLDPTVGDPNVAQVLAFSVKNVPDEWLGAGRKFTITNPDSQKAWVTYQKFKVAGDKVAGDSIKITADPNAPPFEMKGDCLDSHLDVQCAALPGAVSPANGPFRVDRTNGDTVASAYTGTVKKLDGTSAAFVAGDTVTVSVKDDSGFERSWQTTVV